MAVTLAIAINLWNTSEALDNATDDAPDALVATARADLTTAQADPTNVVKRKAAAASGRIAARAMEGKAVGIATALSAQSAALSAAEA